MKYEFKLDFYVVDSNILRYNFSIPEASSDYTNFLKLSFNSPVDEEIYGMGM